MSYLEPCKVHSNRVPPDARSTGAREGRSQIVADNTMQIDPDRGAQGAAKGLPLCTSSLASSRQ